MTTSEGVLSQIRTVRLYTKDLLRHVDESDWFRQPAEGVTHIAWQVGHLAVTQYGLALRRVRGEKPEDDELVPREFRTLFGKGSIPNADSAGYPTPEEITAVLDRIHRQVLDEIPALDEETLSEPSTEPPHPMFNTRRGALLWNAQHEFIHAGQIGLLRRLLGADPLR